MKITTFQLLYMPDLKLSKNKKERKIVDKLGVARALFKAPRGDNP